MTSNNNYQVIIKESNSFVGIPYSDYFDVKTEWLIISNTKSLSDEENGLCECFITISLEVVFHKFTWLKSTIEANTKSELITVYDKWLAYARETLKKRKQLFAQQNQIMSKTSNICNLSTSLQLESASNELQYENLEQPAAEDLCIPPDDVFMAMDENMNLSNILSFVSGVSVNISKPDNNGTTNGSSRMSDIDINMPATDFYSDDNGYSYGYGYASDDDLQFFDCDEGEKYSSGSECPSSNPETYWANSTESREHRGINGTPCYLLRSPGGSGRGQMIVLGIWHLQ